MKNDIIVTIAREHGSGGRSIGKKLAEKMNVPFYDRELIYLAAKESGLSENFIKEVEEKPSRSFIYNMYMTGTGSFRIGSGIYCPDEGHHRDGG